MNESLLGYNDERLDPVSGTYHLGNGYRAYSPALMRFTCPDSWSPFGAGGINPYAYCAGDPVNRSDPSGHLSWMAWTGIGLGVAGLALAAFTGGASIAAAGGLMVAIDSASAVALAVGGAGVFADVAGIASGALEERNPRDSAILGWASLASGSIGAGLGLGRAASRATASLRQRLGSIRNIGLSGRGRGFWSAALPLQSTTRIPGEVHVLGITRGDQGTDELVLAFQSGWRRLDVLGHMRRLDTGAAAMSLNDGLLNGEEFDQILRGVVDDYGSYESIRLLTCLSAYEGFRDNLSFAETLARASGKPVVGYRGVMQTYMHPDLEKFLEGKALFKYHDSFKQDAVRMRGFFKERMPGFSEEQRTVLIYGIARTFLPRWFV